MPDLDRSRALIERAGETIPGGVNSPVRAFKGVGGTPVFFESGAGAYLTDVDGNRYVDYVGSWGPMILGHAAQPVLDAVTGAPVPEATVTFDIAGPASASMTSSPSAGDGVAQATWSTQRPT